MSKYITVICLLAVFAVHKVRASGFALYEASVRITGMMGAYVANGHDVSTIFFNPAGLAQLSGLHISVGAAFIAPRDKFRGPLPYSVNEYMMEKQTFFVPDAYASYSVTPKLSFGLGMYVPYGLGTKWKPGWVGGRFALKTNLQVMVLNPVVSYRLPDIGPVKTYIGGGVIIGIKGDATLSREVTDFVGQTGVQTGTVYLDGSQEKTPVGYNLGIIIKPSDMLSFGFTYRSQLKLKLRGNAVFTDLPTSGFPNGVVGSLKITTPANWAAGVNVHPTRNLSVEFDYVWYGWSSFDSLNVHFDTHTPALQDINSPRLYHNTSQYRLGAEYNVEKITGLTVRGGITYDQNPIPDRTLDPILPDANRWDFSCGLSYQITPQVSFDAFYMFIRAKERKIDTPQNPLEGYYNTKANLFGAALSFSF